MTKSGGSTDTATRQGTYYFDAYALTNTSVPVAGTLTASDGPNSAGFPAYLAKTAEGFTYDADGNMTQDGRWDYTYDAENRITRMQSTSAAATALGGDARRIDFVYDYLGRRVRKTVYSGSSYGTTVSDEKFVWNGWLLIAKLNAASSNALLASYYWGTDLSGNTQGAGGVGGLLMTQENSNAYLPLYDAMGNVHAMLKASDGSLAAAYEYDAFGRTLRADGADATFAASNPWRFSTKYTDAESGLVYYGHRYYSPSMGRFINRDPIEEQGGLNLYAFCGNNGVNRWDYLGMDPPDFVPPPDANGGSWVTVGPGINVYIGPGGGSHVGITSSVDVNQPRWTAPQEIEGIAVWSPQDSPSLLARFGSWGNPNTPSLDAIFSTIFSTGSTKKGTVTLGPLQVVESDVELPAPNSTGKGYEPPGVLASLGQGIAGAPQFWADKIAALKPTAMGNAVSGANINPLPGSGGVIAGYNTMSFAGDSNILQPFTYTKIAARGLDVGVSLESVYAWGKGAWTGEFDSVKISVGIFTASVFWSPGSGGWAGVTGGFGLGLPGAAYEKTDYKKLEFDPTK